MYMAVIFNDSILAKHVSYVLNADLTLIKHSIPALNSLLVLILVTLASHCIKYTSLGNISSHLGNHSNMAQMQIDFFCKFL